MKEQWIYKTAKVRTKDRALVSDLKKHSKEGWELVQLYNKTKEIDKSKKEKSVKVNMWTALFKKKEQG